MVMHGPHIWRWITQSIEHCQNRAWIASAYVTRKRLDALINHLQRTDIEKMLIVRWQLHDLLSGASDLETYEIAKDNGWDFFINLDLHAKTYLFDNSCAIGSANLTERGMNGISPPGNREILATSAELTSVTKWFLELKKSSRLIDDELYKKIKNEVHELSAEEYKIDLGNVQFSDPLLIDLLPKKDLVIYTRDLFWSNNAESIANLTIDDKFSTDIEHDLLLLDIKNSRDLRAIKDRYIASKAFLWLLESVHKQAYFGELSSILHSSLKDDPIPFRKDVKVLLRNLLVWTSLYGKDFFHIDQPNVSQRITRI